MSRVEQKTKELLGLGFIALLGLATLFLITEMIETTGNFVYAGGKVQLDTKEACAQITDCKAAPAVFASFAGWQFNQQPGQYALCVCPEDVFKWEKDIPKIYDKSKVRIIPLVQNYAGGMYIGNN